MAQAVAETELIIQIPWEPQAQPILAEAEAEAKQQMALDTQAVQVS